MPSINTFLDGAARARPQFGLWCSLAHPITTELCAGAGYDWLLIDMEHAPNEIGDVYAQLQAASAYPVECVVRPPSNDPVMIKRLLDIGVRSLLIPFIETAEQASAAVRSTRYPPHGVRGLTMSSRANRFGRDSDYLRAIEREIRVVVQVESRAGVDHIEQIAKTPGVSAVFIGPSDLSADLGFLGQPGAARPRQVISSTITKLNALNTPWGILAPVEADAKAFAELGASFIALGSDQSLLVRAADQLAGRFVVNTHIASE